MKRIAASLAIVGLLLGTPTLLVFVFGSPTLPRPDLTEFLQSLSGQLLSAESVFRMLGRLAWLLWAYIAGLALLRIIALKVLTPRSKAGPALSKLTGRLSPSFILRIIDIALGGALLLSPLTIPVSATAALGSQAPLVDTSAEHSSEHGQSSSYLVRPGDSLWEIAERELGSGERWREIFELNKGRQFSDGRTLTEPRLIHPNWLLWLPGPKGATEELHGAPGQASEAEKGQTADPTPPPSSTQSVKTSDEDSAGSNDSSSAVVRLPASGALAASFVAGVIASQTIAAFRRRRSFRPDDPTPEDRQEPSIVVEGRRAGLTEQPRVDAALATLKSAWPTASDGWPPVIACIEGPSSATFLLDGAERTPGLRSTPSIRFSDDGLQAEVKWQPQLSSEPLTALEQGSFVPIGNSSASESISYRLLGNPPLSVAGRLADEFTSNLLLACAAGRSVHEVELVVLGTELQLGPVAEIPHLRQIPWEHTPEVLTELRAEALGRARIFAQHGASDLNDFLSAGAPEHLPALVVVTAPPPRRLQDSIEALASNAAASGLGFVGAGWRPSATRLALEVDSQIAIDTDLQIPDPLDPALLSKSDKQEVVDILIAASSEGHETNRVEQPTVEPCPLDNGIPFEPDAADLSAYQEAHQGNGEIVVPDASPLSDSTFHEIDEEAGAQIQNHHSPDQTDPEPLPEPAGSPPSVGTREQTVSPNRIEVRCLGPMSISRGDTTIHKGWIKGSKELLAYLIVNREGVPKDRILEVMWPDAKLKEGEKLLRDALYHLRKQTLGPEDAKWSEDYVRRAGETLVLGGDDRWWCDVWEFESLASTAGRLEPQESKVALRRALSLYGGEFCDDCYFSWAEQLRERYRRLYLRSCAKLAEILEDDGEVDEAIEILELGIQIDRFCEDLYRRLIRLEASQGRTNGAIRLFQQLTKLLDRELDLEPEPQTLKMMDEIRNTFRPRASSS